MPVVGISERPDGQQSVAVAHHQPLDGATRINFAESLDGFDEGTPLADDAISGFVCLQIGHCAGAIYQ